MSVPGIGPIVSSATVAAIGTGDAFTKGRDSAEAVRRKRVPLIWARARPLSQSTARASLMRVTRRLS
jgi:hypothetical protein